MIPIIDRQPRREKMSTPITKEGNSPRPMKIVPKMTSDSGGSYNVMVLETAGLTQ